MTTENQIQVNLNKFKSKKQNLGAIEDAVNEVKNDLISISDNMLSIVQDLEMAITKYDEDSAKATSDLSDAQREADLQFSLLQEDAFVRTNELDNLGISVGVNIDAVIEKYMQFYDIADSKI